MDVLIELHRLDSRRLFEWYEINKQKQSAEDRIKELDPLIRNTKKVLYNTDLLHLLSDAQNRVAALGGFVDAHFFCGRPYHSCIEYPRPLQDEVYKKLANFEGWNYSYIRGKIARMRSRTMSELEYQEIERMEYSEVFEKAKQQDLEEQKELRNKMEEMKLQAASNNKDGK